MKALNILLIVKALNILLIVVNSALAASSIASGEPFSAAIFTGGAVLALIITYGLKL